MDDSSTAKRSHVMYVCLTMVIEILIDTVTVMHTESTHYIRARTHTLHTFHARSYKIKVIASCVLRKCQIVFFCSPEILIFQ